MADLPLPLTPPDSTASGAAATESLLHELSKLVEGDVRLGRHDRLLYATDASIYQVEPLAVVLPRHVNDVEAVVAFCRDQRLPVLPRGAGTSLAGQTVNEAVVIDFSPHCRAVHEIDAERRLARVEPGVVLDDLNDALAGHGLMFGPDVATSSHANIGGMIGNNSAGAHSILFGRTVEHLEALDVLLADGTRLHLEEGAAARDERVHELTARLADVVRPLGPEIRRRYPTTRRRVNGYNLDLLLDQMEACTPGTFDRVNLAHLVCGSEGTLAVTTGATLRLVERPRARGLAVAAFPGLDAALAALIPVLDTGPSAVELIDDVVIAAAARNEEYGRYVELLPRLGGAVPGAVLYIEYFRAGPDEVGAALRALSQVLPGAPLAHLTDEASMVRAWKLRKAGEPLLHGLPGRRKPVTFVEDLAVDAARLAEFVQSFRALVARHGTTAAYYAHASVGCLHIRPLICLRDPGDLGRMRAIAEEAADLVRSFGGALSGEHGDGRARSHLLERFYGEAICEGFRAVKSILDPEHRLNPGNIIAGPAIDAQLRVRPRDAFVHVPAVRTFYRYEQEHGFAEAVERCNGAGVCRRTTGGTMCPSYRATRDERHATRGRGNALRLAITGQLSGDGRPAWNDAETLRTLDLCLSCKACRTECPSNVDIARLKAEYLAQSYESGAPVPRSSRVFGHVRAWNRLGSALAPWSNLVAGTGLVRRALAGLLDIDPRRSLPVFGPSLRRWNRRRPRPRDEATRPAVVLFPDCFSLYSEPTVGRAAVRLLERLGYAVRLPRTGCCGRAMISLGLLRDAAGTCRRTATDLLAALDAPDVVGIVGLEPSCVSAITNDWTDLELDVPAASIRSIADRTWSIESFIESRWDAHPRRPEQVRPAASAPILLHGHCHQKSLGGFETDAAAIRRCAGERLELLDSGCCGMAGAFGFTRDHYELSMRIGEASLFGSIRAQPGAVVLAPGTSCRHQIFDGTGIRAQHPAEYLDRILGGSDDPPA
ncbi:MAG: FAD-binding and (Fe-S)-binding domain-containing protein [Planctomycetota bacterium]|jgi:FAD/FMN-containing dehydrogenase/Fe-S oxidoreductase